MTEHRPKTPSPGGELSTAAQMRQQVHSLLCRDAAVSAGEKVIVAVSGGVDSMVLLDILDHLGKTLGLVLHVACFDHQLRPESAADLEFVAQAARARHLSCTCKKGDVRAYARHCRLSVEAAGRVLRYGFLDEVARRVGAGKIALGHHADDQAETVLLHLLRGSGTAGLAGMELLREGRYLRPLLYFRRTCIEAYAGECGLAFREDASNRDLSFGRNRMRHALLPLLQRDYNPGIVGVLCRTARVLRDEDLFLNEMAQQALETVICECYPGKIILAARRLLDYHIAIQRRLVRILLQGLSQGEGPFDFAQVEAVLMQLRQSHSTLRSLRGGLWVQGAGDIFVLRRGQAAPVALELLVPGEVRIPSRGLALRAQLLPAAEFPALRAGLGGRRAAFDAGATGHRLILRSPRPGDRIQPLGMSGHKKVSELLIDLKWPRIRRDEVLLLARSEEIIWVAGLRSSHRFRVRRHTREVLLVELGPMPA